MRSPTLVAVVVLLGGCAGTSSVTADAPGLDLRAFIGAPIQVEHAGYACHTYAVAADGSEECMLTDSVYRGRYRVVETFVGPLPESEVTLRMAGHGGVPDDVHRPFVLLLARKAEDGLRLMRYQAYAAHRTVEGRWAVCGDPLAGEGESQAQPLQFPPGADFGPPASDPYFVKRLLDEAEPGDYEERDGRLLCRRGIFVEEIVGAWGQPR